MADTLTIPMRDGAELAVDIAGDGPTLILISGLGGTAGFWTPLVEALGPGLRTICFDQRGIGRSDRGVEPVTIRSLAADVWEIVDTLRIAEPVLCGHSTGGAIVQEMALTRAGAAAGIVLSGSWAGPDDFMERMFGIRLDLLVRVPEWYAEMGTLLGSPPRWLHDNPGAFKQASRQLPDKREAGIIRERIQALLAHNCRDRLSSVSVPSLVLGSEDDMIVPVYLQEEFAALLPRTQMHIFDRGGHFFPVTRAVETAQELRRWLAGLELSGGVD